MEKKILLVGANKKHSKKNGEDYYIIEYVDKQNNACKSLVKNINDMEETTFNRFKAKIKKGEVVEVTGIFELNEYDRAELVDIK